LVSIRNVGFSLDRKPQFLAVSNCARIAGVTESVTIRQGSSRSVASRRRGVQLEHAILDAAWQLLSEGDPGQLTMAVIAEKAGTSKPVLYRRWANASQLILSALEYEAPAPEIRYVDNGSLREDLLAIMRAAGAWFTGMPPTVIRTLSSATTVYPELRGLLPERINLVDIRPAMRKALLRAVQRGEITEHVVGDRLLRLPLDLMFLESLNGIPVAQPEQFLSEVVGEILVPAFAGTAGPK
jgi:AcrR family transcriptional regulator